MPNQDGLILIGIGGLFLILGLVTVIWGRKEEKSYYNTLSTRYGDQREFMEHWPPRLQPSALKIGGLIAITVGAVMLVTGGILSLVG